MARKTLMVLTSAVGIAAVAAGAYVARHRRDGYTAVGTAKAKPLSDGAVRRRRSDPGVRERRQGRVGHVLLGRTRKQIRKMARPNRSGHLSLPTSIGVNDTPVEIPCACVGAAAVRPTYVPIADRRTSSISGPGSLMTPAHAGFVIPVTGAVVADRAGHRPPGTGPVSPFPSARPGIPMPQRSPVIYSISTKLRKIRMSGRKLRAIACAFPQSAPMAIRPTQLSNV